MSEQVMRFEMALLAAALEVRRSGGNYAFASKIPQLLERGEMGHRKEEALRVADALLMIVKDGRSSTVHRREIEGLFAEAVRLGCPVSVNTLLEVWNALEALRPGALRAR